MEISNSHIFQIISQGCLGEAFLAGKRQFPNIDDGSYTHRFQAGNEGFYIEAFVSKGVKMC